MSNTVLAGLAALLGAAPLCAICLTPEADSASWSPPITASADTATAKLAITGMTCGSCATTARIALQRVSGVYRAEVSYDSASAVVWYDPARAQPARFIVTLKEMTGYVARVIERAPAKPAS